MISHSNKAFFSVVIPTKGRAFLLGDTIRSVLNQDFIDFELIIVDNDDGDATQQVVDEFTDKRIKYVRTGGLSMAENWQHGLNCATGAYVVLNADKCLLKEDALTTLAALLEKYAGIDVISFQYDAFYDQESLYLRREFGRQPEIVDCQQIIDLLHESKFDEFANYAPRGYNACVSNEIISKICALHGEICLPYNPDYTFAYHVIHSSSRVLYLPYALQIVRFKSLFGKSS